VIRDLVIRRSGLGRSDAAVDRSAKPKRGSVMNAAPFSLAVPTSIDPDAENDAQQKKTGQRVATPPR
jgi:hypothetical protein